MATFGEKTIETAGEMLVQHLKDHQKDIAEAYYEMDDVLTVSMGVKFSAGVNGVRIDTKIAFKTGEIKDAGFSEVDNDQMPLFSGK